MYDGFMQNWTASFCAFNHVENSVLSFFRAVMVLI